MEDQPRTAIANVGLILGILALALSIVPFLGVYGVIPAVTALVLGIVGRRRAARQDGIGRGRATAAMWLGGLSTLLAVAQTVSVPAAMPA